MTTDPETGVEELLAELRPIWKRLEKDAKALRERGTIPRWKAVCIFGAIRSLDFWTRKLHKSIHQCDPDQQTTFKTDPEARDQ